MIHASGFHLISGLKKKKQIKVKSLYFNRASIIRQVDACSDGELNFKADIIFPSVKLIAGFSHDLYIGLETSLKEQFAQIRYYL